MLHSKIGLFFALLLIVTLASCSKNTKTEEEFLTTAKTQYDSALAKKDNNLFTESINTYREFMKEYPKSEKVLFAYNQIAKTYDENLADYPNAIKTYTEIYEKYPTTKEAKQSLFLIAFAYDEKMKDKENAKIAYKKFLEKYPTDTDANEKLSESAKVMLQTLESGTSIDDIIKKIESQDGNKDTKDKKEPKDKNIDVDKKKDDTKVKIEKLDDTKKKPNN